MVQKRFSVRILGRENHWQMIDHFVTEREAKDYIIGRTLTLEHRFSHYAIFDGRLKLWDSHSHSPDSSGYRRR